MSCEECFYITGHAPDCAEYALEREDRLRALEAENEALKAKVAGYDALIMSYEDVIEYSSKWLHDSTQWQSDETLAPKWRALWDRHAELAK